MGHVTLTTPSLGVYVLSVS